MNGDVGRIQGGYRVQAAAEAVVVILGKAGDEIHVDGGETGVHSFPVGPDHIGSLVGPSAGPEDMIFHGLGIDAHPVRAMLADGAQFFRIQGVGTAALHGEFDTPGQVEGIPDGVQKTGHLRTGEGGGGTAANVDGPKGSAGICQKSAGNGNFLHQRL